MEVRELVQRVGPGTTTDETTELLDHPEAEEAHVLAVLRKRNLATAAIEAIARHIASIPKKSVKKTKNRPITDTLRSTRFRVKL